MSYQVLARKWRPKSFKQMVGQEHVVQALVNGLDQDRVHHAFLFTGTRGVGKTTLARIFAKCLNCETGTSSEPCGECSSCVDIDEGRFVDIIEIDAASRTKVEDTRELLESVQYSPSRGRYKVYIIDEVHMLSNSSFNALLKTLEEPPPHVKFVLATTDPDKIPVTILSRCLQFNLRRMTPQQVQENLQQIVQAEKIEAAPEALSRLARAADGSMRDGLSLLDQAIAFGGGKLSLDDVKQMLGLVDHGHVVALVQALAEADARRILDIIEEWVVHSRDLDAVLVSLAETLHRICLLKCVADYSDNERGDWDAIRAVAALISLEDAQLFYQIAITGREELGIAPDPRTGLEMTLLRMLAFRPATATGSPSTTGSAGDHTRQASKVAAASVASLASSGEADKTHQQLFASHQNSSPAKSSAASVNPVSDVASSPQSEPPRVAGSVGKESALNGSELIEVSWLEMAEALTIKGMVRELARNLQLKSAQNQQWQFVIDHSLRHLATADSIERLQTAISERLGSEIRMQLSDSVEGLLHTAAAVEQSRRRTQLTEAERSIGEDPTVSALKKNLGAQIIEDSIQPLQ